MKTTLRLVSKLMILFILPGYFFTVTAQITWPQDQILPTFPNTAQTQDLILIRSQNGQLIKWEAEGPRISHSTGRLETDGWLCQAGIDAPNLHMVYGPYDRSIPAGDHVAEFRVKTDNNTAADVPVININVRNATTGQDLGTRTITRRQFSAAGSYVTFTLPFSLSANNQSLELRVFWHGGAYMKVDYVGVRTSGDAEMYLFSSLKGIINKKQPRIFSYEGDAFAEGRYTWLNSLGLGYNEYSDNWELISKYRNEIDGIIIYDPAQLHTVNFATMIAGEKNALIASPQLAERLKAAPYNLPVVEDLRGRFSNKLQVYETVFNDYWPSKNKRILMGISPRFVKAAVREYAVASGLPTIWLDPKVPGESELLNKFLSSMPAGAHYMGWWPEEGAGITRASEFGIPTIPSDYATNLTVHSGMPRDINIKPIPPKPPLRNKIYVAFILSDGDNLQFVEHLMRKLWSHPQRGSVPIGWTISPAMADAMPGALNYFYESATDNDNLISGPSGLGYIYPNYYPNDNKLAEFVKRTESYNQKTGIRVITIWNTITGGIDRDAGEVYARNAPSTLGLTGQNTGGPLSIYNGTLPGKPLSCNYCWDVNNMSSHIASASQGWNRNEPRFVIIQSQPWRNTTPETFRNVADGLNGDYEVVRPDHLFQLLRESKGLPINPGGNTVLPEPPAGYTAWKSFNLPNQHIRHANSRGRIDLNINPNDDAYWKMVPGLAGQGVSFQSRNFPNRYLRHRGGQVWLDGFQDTNLFKNDATFVVRPGLSDASQTSFESVNIPGAFIRHKNSLLFVESVTEDLARKDATFIQIGNSPGTGGGNAFSLKIEAENWASQSGTQKEACVEGGENVGWIDKDDWLVYDANIPSTGTYTIEYRVASPNNIGNLQIENAGGTPVYGSLRIPNTEGWQNWTTVSHTINLSAGAQQIGIKALEGGWNINWIQIKGSQAKSAGLEETKKLSVYPNPASHTLRIDNVTENGIYYLFNTIGQKIKEYTADQLQKPIDISDIPAGLYFVNDIINQKSTRFSKK